MPRTARIILPNYPHHIIQRGHNRQSVFASGDDYRYYLDNLAEWKEKFDCKVYAFCLMTNHVHLVVNPGDDPDSIGRLMKRLAGRQTRFVNRLEGRSGTLWEGRFKSSPIDNNDYLLACCRYVEMNPVFAGMCDDPATYAWSSCGSKVTFKKFEWLDEDPLYLDLGKTDEERRQKYRDFLQQSISDEEKETILGAVQRGQLTGGEAFVDEIEFRMNRRIELRGRGRPRKEKNNFHVPF
jgi:putative transposase